MKLRPDALGARLTVPLGSWESPTRLVGSGTLAAVSSLKRWCPLARTLERDFRASWSNDAFKERYNTLLRDYAGRPSALTECENLSERLGVRVLLKREDLNHTG